MNVRKLAISGPCALKRSFTILKNVTTDSSGVANAAFAINSPLNETTIASIFDNAEFVAIGPFFTGVKFSAMRIKV